MSIEVGSVLAGVAALLVFVAVPVVWARRSGGLLETDIALLVVPAGAFLVALALFNKPALTGWAFILYPWLVLVCSVGVLYVRVFLLPRIGVAASVASKACLAVCTLAAVVFGSITPPFYE
jgi:hypothetical protein